jgi:hypothetical protein
VDRRLAISDVVRKLNSAIQFCGSAIVNLPTGGRKKKLNVSVAAIEASADSTKPHVLAINRTSTRYANPTVVALTGISLCAVYVTIATPVSEHSNRNARRTNVLRHLSLIF